MSATCGDNGTATITDSAQATAISTCTAYLGSIAVAGSFTGDLTLNGIEAITGNLSANLVPGLTSLSADSLRIIRAVEVFESGLTSLTLPALQVVQDQIQIAHNPLETLDLSLLNHTEAIFIQNNTELKKIDISKLASADEVAVQGNGQGEMMLDLSRLTWATHLLVSHCSSVNLNLLDSTGDATFILNTFATLSFPSLTSVLGGLTIENNTNLTSISAPVLTTIELPGDATYQNALTIYANPALTGTIEFPAAVEIKHNADIYGNFSSFLLPALTTFSGNLTIESTEDIASTCNRFDDISRAHSTIDFSTKICLYPSTHSSSGRWKAVVGGIGGAVGVCVILGILFVGITFRKVHGKGIGRRVRGSALNGERGIELPNYGSLSHT